MDINTTKYLVKPNSETTRYFTQDGGQQVIDDLQNQINQKENITDHDDDVLNLQNQINNIPINPYEGLFYYSYGLTPKFIVRPLSGSRW